MTSPSSESARPRVRLRRNPRWLLAGVLAVVLGGLGSAFLFMSVAASDPVVRVNRTIHRGEIIAAADVSVVTVGRGIDVRTVPGAKLNEVIGSAAITDLPGGSLLVADTYGSAAVPSGQSIVGVRLEAGRLPTSGLTPGTTVLVVALPAPSAPGAAAEALPASVTARLQTAPTQLPDGSWVVDVALAADRAEGISRLSSAGRVALVRLG